MPPRPARRLGLIPVEAVRRALKEEPLARAAGGLLSILLPDTFAGLVQLDDALPDVVDALNARAAAQLRNESKGLDRSLSDAIDDLLCEAGKRTPKRRRLKRKRAE